MIVTIIGTTSYKDRMLNHKNKLENDNHTVFLPAFDDFKNLDEIGVCEYNLDKIKTADEIHIFWDQRSTGTIFDFGMCFALKKRIKIFYLQPKTFTNLMKKYENLFTD